MKSENPHLCLLKKIIFNGFELIDDYFQFSLCQ